MKIQIKKNVYFAYYRDMEYVAALTGILADHVDGRICREIYGEEFIARIRRKHRELAEIVNSFHVGGLEILEFYMDYKGEAFNLEEYYMHMKNMDTLDFLFKLFGYHVDREEIKLALKDEELLVKLMDEGKTQINSYVNLKRIINHREEFLDLFYAGLKDIQTPELEAYLDQYEKRLPILQSELEEKLQVKEPIEITRDIVNNCSIQKRDYELYGFIPLCMLPRNTVNYHYKDQFVLYSKRGMQLREKALAILKVVTDDTRIRIIDLLSECGTANGKKISRCLQLAPSTVSHHMEQLVECEVVKEEKRGNSKVYSIDHVAGENFVRELESIILKNTEHR